MSSSDQLHVKPLKLSLVWQYYRIAQDALAAVYSILEEPDFRSDSAPLGYEEVQLAFVLGYDQNERLEHEILTCCLFSAFAVEAFVNCLLRENASGFYRRKLDTLDFVGKYALAIHVIYRQEIPADSTVLSGLKRLSRLRNQLVHSRPSYFNYEEIREMLLSRLKPEDAADAFTACKAAIYKVAEIDPLFEHGQRAETEYRTAGWQALLEEARQQVRQCGGGASTLGKPPAEERSNNEESPNH